MEFVNQDVKLFDFNRKVYPVSLQEACSKISDVLLEDISSVPKGILESNGFFVVEPNNNPFDDQSIALPESHQ